MALEGIAECHVECKPDAGGKVRDEKCKTGVKERRKEKKRNEILQIK